MATGTGIAIAGLWVYAGLVAHSDSTTNQGFWTSLAIALGGTAMFLWGIG
jgi:hypothetical protein